MIDLELLKQPSLFLIRPLSHHQIFTTGQPIPLLLHVPDPCLDALNNLLFFLFCFLVIDHLLISYFNCPVELQPYIPLLIKVQVAICACTSKDAVFCIIGNILDECFFLEWYFYFLLQLQVLIIKLQFLAVGLKSKKDLRCYTIDGILNVILVF